MFSRIKNKWEQIKAVGIVDELLKNDERLEQVLVGRGEESMDLAYDIVMACWNVTPYLFNGYTGKRPHASTIAAMSIAYAIWCAHESSKLKGTVYTSMIKALVVLLREINAAITRGSLVVNPTDTQLLMQVTVLANNIDVHTPSNPVELYDKVFNNGGVEATIS